MTLFDDGRFRLEGEIVVQSTNSPSVEMIVITSLLTGWHAHYIVMVHMHYGMNNKMFELLNEEIKHRGYIWAPQTTTIGSTMTSVLI